MRNAFVDSLFDIASTNKNLILLTGDLGFGVLSKFWNSYPDQFINAGICEQNMASLAAGMALEGKLVFIYSIGNFPTLRCLEQIRNDIAYHQANVKIIALGGGFSYGAMGMTHHATEDIAIMRALPNLTVFTPCDPVETRKVTEWSARINTPCYIRLGRGGEPCLLDKTAQLEIGKPHLIREGEDTVIFSFGPIVSEALSAAQMLEEKKIKCAVYSCHTVKPLEQKTILDICARYEHVFSLEEHSRLGGGGAAIAEIMSEHRASYNTHILALEDTFCSTVGSQSYLRKACLIDANSIFRKIWSILCVL